MREALYLTAMLAALAALVRAAGRTGVLGAIAGASAAVAFSLGAWLDAPSPLRGACWLFGTAFLCKALALGRIQRGTVGLGRGLAYVFLWPGLDASRAFVKDPATRRAAGFSSATLGAIEVAAGLVFISFADHRGWLEGGAYVPAWCRLLSFGSFLDGGFRAMEGVLEVLGFRPERVFRAPWKMRDLADFWGERWNRFVSKTLAFDVFSPTKRKFGRSAALMLTFFQSGVLHEALFRGSADGPDGRYVVFFLIHGFAVAETVGSRARAGEASLLRRGIAWAILLATAPLFFGGCYPAVAPFERLLAWMW